MAVLPTVSAVLLHHSALDTGTEKVLLFEGRGEILVIPAVTAVLLHYNVLDTGTDFRVVCAG